MTNGEDIRVTIATRHQRSRGTSAERDRAQRGRVVRKFRDCKQPVIPRLFALAVLPRHPDAGL